MILFEKILELMVKGIGRWLHRFIKRCSNRRHSKNHGRQSYDRVERRCQFARQCGGCQLQALL